ncbi:hypothetical protein FDP41_008437 [Naegleria fowleri]|uniref:Uncharacterized protein n=1 Tax=Naegleria fowleri TaxID=5763 RepID=A0A6A5BGU2_NAEFO|nr:uncharacterized protein FDP41_008437 [Naegleria fowleri]KAF0973230.1 hypothetical protein FDP41_008437 [Naegleria fowleri]CAG4713033.1 unnamed protein product [Naegleria fowleri]
MLKSSSRVVLLREVGANPNNLKLNKITTTTTNNVIQRHYSSSRHIKFQNTTNVTTRVCHDDFQFDHHHLQVSSLHEVINFQSRYKSAPTIRHYHSSSLLLNDVSTPSKSEKSQTNDTHDGKSESSLGPQPSQQQQQRDHPPVPPQQDASDTHRITSSNDPHPSKAHHYHHHQQQHESHSSPKQTTTPKYSFNYQDYQQWIGKAYSLMDRVKQYFDQWFYKMSYYGKFYYQGLRSIVTDTKKYMALKKEINNNRPFHLANRSEILFTTQYSIEVLKAIPFIVLIFPFSVAYYIMAFIFPILLPSHLVLPRRKVQILNNINRIRKEQKRLIIERLLQFTNLVNNKYIKVDDELMEQCNQFTNILRNISKYQDSKASFKTHQERKEFISKLLNDMKKLDRTKFVDQYLKFHFMSTTLLDDICRFALIGRSHLGGISGAIKEDNTSSILGLRKYDPNILQQLIFNFLDVLASHEQAQALTPNTVKMYQLNRFIKQMREDDKFIFMDEELSNVLNTKEETPIREWLKICYVRGLVDDPTCYGGVNTVLITSDDLKMAGKHAPQTSTTTVASIPPEKVQELISELKELHALWYKFTENIKSNELQIITCVLLK